jgi:hypothetical protein
MAKCSMVSCPEPPVGGFQQVLDAGHMEDPGATILGSKTFWCRDHESALRPTTSTKRGYYLKADRIPKE